jgi:hypothetical protein
MTPIAIKGSRRTPCDGAVVATVGACPERSRRNRRCLPPFPNPLSPAGILPSAEVPPSAGVPSFPSCTWERPCLRNSVALFRALMRPTLSRSLPPSVPLPSSVRNFPLCFLCALSWPILFWPITAPACGLDWTLPQAHFEGVDENGYVAYWEKIGQADLGDGLVIPVNIGFNSHRETSSPTLGKGWILPPPRIPCRTGRRKHRERYHARRLDLPLPSQWQYRNLAR